MKTKILTIIISLTFLVLTLNLASALIVDAEYITIFPGEEVSIKVEVDNNENFDIEDVSVALILDGVPFTSVGSSEKDTDDIDEDDDDSVTFRIKTSTDVVPGDYDIPYIMKYTNAEDSNATSQTKNGTFGIRVSSKTELDFSVEKKDAIVGQQGRLSLKIVNKGLGEVKFVSVEIFPQGFELLSSENVYIGNIDSDDSDTASYDVIFKSTAPVLSVKVEYKDFDNKAQTKTINLPVEAYTRERAIELGLIQEPNYVPYGIGAGILILWYIIRKIKKRKKNKQRGRN